MNDNVRTHIQDFLEDFCNIEIDKTEYLAESLNDYLDERGFCIVDKFIYAFYKKK